VENFGWMDVWGLNPEWLVYVGQRPLRPGGIMLAEGHRDWGEGVQAIPWYLIVPGITLQRRLGLEIRLSCHSINSDSSSHSNHIPAEESQCLEDEVGQ
jgi:hypothetical protein